MIEEEDPFIEVVDARMVPPICIVLYTPGTVFVCDTFSEAAFFNQRYTCPLSEESYLDLAFGTK